MIRCPGHVAKGKVSNVRLLLIHDMGFGQPGAFGGPMEMPTLDRIANQGLRYNRFHTAAVCSATHAALLIGNNAHTFNCGEIADNATGFPLPSQQYKSALRVRGRDSRG